MKSRTSSRTEMLAETRYGNGSITAAATRSTDCPFLDGIDSEYEAGTMT